MWPMGRDEVNRLPNLILVFLQRCLLHANTRILISFSAGPERPFTKTHYSSENCGRRKKWQILHGRARPARLKSIQRKIWSIQTVNGPFLLF
jgi:hypothetical protein